MTAHDKLMWVMLKAIENYTKYRRGKSLNSMYKDQENIYIKPHETSHREKFKFNINV